MGWTNTLDYLKKAFGTSGSEATVAAQSNATPNQTPAPTSQSAPNSVIQVKQTEADKRMGISFQHNGSVSLESLDQENYGMSIPESSTPAPVSKPTSTTSVPSGVATKTASEHFNSNTSIDVGYEGCMANGFDAETCGSAGLSYALENPDIMSSNPESMNRFIGRLDEDLAEEGSRSDEKKTQGVTKKTQPSSPKSSKKSSRKVQQNTSTNKVQQTTPSSANTKEEDLLACLDGAETDEQVLGCVDKSFDDIESLDVDQQSRIIQVGDDATRDISSSSEKRTLIESQKIQLAKLSRNQSVTDTLGRSITRSNIEHNEEQIREISDLFGKDKDGQYRFSSDVEDRLVIRLTNDVNDQNDPKLIPLVAKTQTNLREENQKTAIDYAKDLFGEGLSEAYMNALAQNAYNFAESNWDYVTDTVKSSGYESAQQSLETAKQEYNNSTQNANKSTEADKTAQESNTQKTESKAESKTETNSYESKTESKSAISKSTVEAVSEMKKSVNSGNPVINIVSSEKFKNSATKAKVEFIKTLNNKDKKEAVGQICNSTSALGLKSMMFSGLKKDIIKFLVQNHSAENIEKLKYLQNYLSISEKKQLNEYEQCLRENKSLATLGNNIFV